MNIFVTNKNPHRAAMNLCDQHLNKMLLETAQLLCTAGRIRDGREHEVFAYKSTHLNHPCTLWATGNLEYQWLLAHGVAMDIEYTYRTGKLHRSALVIRDIYEVFGFNGHDAAERENIELIFCGPANIEGNDVPARYRQLLRNKYTEWASRARPLVARYTKRRPPAWLDGVPVEVRE